MLLIQKTSSDGAINLGHLSLLIQVGGVTCLPLFNDKVGQTLLMKMTG